MDGGGGGNTELSDEDFQVFAQNPSCVIELLECVVYGPRGVGKLTASGDFANEGLRLTNKKWKFAGQLAAEAAKRSGLTPLGYSEAKHAEFWPIWDHQ